MTLLSDAISDTSTLHLIGERRRCLGAVREMIKLGKSHICNALPQVCRAFWNESDESCF